LKNLRVIDIPAPAVHALVDLADRSMEFQCLIQDGQTQWMNDKGSVTVEPTVRLSSHGGL
jgi:uncharacterized protein YaeQ